MEEYEEITLADIVRTLGKRKLVLGTVFLLVVLAGVAVTVFTPAEYESTTTLVPLEHGDIIKNWLDSRHAAELVATSLGDPLVSELFPDQWNAASQSWIGEPPALEDVGRALSERTSVEYRLDRNTNDRFLALTVTMTDPLLARDVANAFVATLNTLRPELEEITQQEAFDQYYDGSNQQEAERRAEVTAKQKDYWLVLDKANTPQDQSSPNVMLNLALSVVLGLMLAVFMVFFVEWMQNYRAEAKPVEVPAPVEVESKPAEKRRYS